MCRSFPNRLVHEQKLDRDVAFSLPNRLLILGEVTARIGGGSQA